jgi:hypothetical protein
MSNHQIPTILKNVEKNSHQHKKIKIKHYVIQAVAPTFPTGPGKAPSIGAEGGVGIEFKKNSKKTERIVDVEIANNTPTTVFVLQKHPFLRKRVNSIKRFGYLRNTGSDCEGRVAHHLKI